jgi:putative hydrolase
MPIRLDEDWHVHSTFSDGADTVEVNVDRAVWRGLRRLGCVDHVRRSSTFVPEYVATVRRVRSSSPIELSIGVEAKMLDREGRLDLPHDMRGVELVYIADHQWPGPRDALDPATVRTAVTNGTLTATDAVTQLVTATVAAMYRYADTRHLVLAHPFSILPRVGLDEHDLPDEALFQIAGVAVETDTMIEASERWRCPNERMIRVCESLGVTMVAATDAHRADDVGMYDFVHQLAEQTSGT